MAICSLNVYFIIKDLMAFCLMVWFCGIHISNEFYVESLAIILHFLLLRIFSSFEKIIISNHHYRYIHYFQLVKHNVQIMFH